MKTRWNLEQRQPSPAISSSTANYAWIPPYLELNESFPPRRLQCNTEPRLRTRRDHEVHHSKPNPAKTLFPHDWS